MQVFRLSKLFWALAYDLKQEMPDNRIVKAVHNFDLTDEKLNYLDVTVEGGNVLLSYLPKSRIKGKVNEAEAFWAKGRQTGRIGATLKKLLTAEVTDSEVKEFTEALAAKYLENSYDISVVSAKDMIKYFSIETYIEKEGSELWKSCMRYPERQHWFGIYEDLPNLSMVIATKNDKLAGRALLWSDVDVVDTKGQPTDAVTGSTKATFLDRIYAIDPKVKSIIWRWGMENADILHVIPKELEKLFVVKTASQSEKVFLQTPIEKYKYNYYPWIDTMTHFRLKDMVLTNYKPGSDASFQSNEGTYVRHKAEMPTHGQIRAELAGDSKKKDKKPLRPLSVTNATPTPARIGFDPGGTTSWVEIDGVRLQNGETGVGFSGATYRYSNGLLSVEG